MGPREKVSIDVTVPSCTCCATRLEQELQELSTVFGIPKGAMRLVVPVKAQLRYDPHVVNLGMVVDTLRAKGCDVGIERAVFKIPARPALLPFMWNEKIKRLAERVEGVISASVNFQASRITVDYLPGLVDLKEIREAVIGWGALRSHSRKEDVNGDKTTDAAPAFVVSRLQAA